MSRKRRRSPGGTAAGLVIEALKKRDAVSPETAVPLKVFKDLPLETKTLGYTIANLVEEGIVVRTPEDKYWFDPLAWKALEVKFMKGYSMIFLVPILTVAVLWLLMHYMF